MSYAFGLFLLPRRNCQISTDYARAAKALNPEHVTVMNGCCAVLAMLSTVLCDPGDGYLIPTPYYGGINLKTWLYGGIQPVHVPLFSEVADKEGHPFQLTVEKLEDALQRAKKQVEVKLLYFSCFDKIGWITCFFPPTKSNLKKQRNILVDGLADVGIPVLRSSGGLLCVGRLQKSIQRLEQMLHSYIAEPVTNNTSSTADALCNPEKDSSGRPSNTPGKDVSQLKNILVY